MGEDKEKLTSREMGFGLCGEQESSRKALDSWVRRDKP